MKRDNRSIISTTYYLFFNEGREGGRREGKGREGKEGRKGKKRRKESISVDHPCERKEGEREEEREE